MQLTVKKLFTILPNCPICKNVIEEVAKKRHLTCFKCNRFQITKRIRQPSVVFSLVMDRVVDEDELLRYHYVIHNHQMNIISVKKMMPMEDRFFNTVSNELAFKLFADPEQLYAYFSAFERENKL